ncbi:MAG: hypothetical protein OEY89_09020 [Gammaproteobacteria bacterium]|nr:hypothetical protein [Gammaproteobacteria bacterium]
MDHYWLNEHIAHITDYFLGFRITEADEGQVKGDAFVYHEYNDLYSIDFMDETFDYPVFLARRHLQNYSRGNSNTETVKQFNRAEMVDQIRATLHKAAELAVQHEAGTINEHDYFKILTDCGFEKLLSSGSDDVERICCQLEEIDRVAEQLVFSWRGPSMNKQVQRYLRESQDIWYTYAE